MSPAAVAFALIFVNVFGTPGSVPAGRVALAKQEAETGLAAHSSVVPIGNLPDADCWRAVIHNVGNGKIRDDGEAQFTACGYVTKLPDDGPHNVHAQVVRPHNHNVTARINLGGSVCP